MAFTNESPSKLLPYTYTMHFLHVYLAEHFKLQQLQAMQMIMYAT